MDAVGFLRSIRARAAARGMTLAALARAAGMQPSNLRRMLSHPSATCRLGTVMRLLPPLGCHVAPSGADTADALVAFLDEQGRRFERSWDTLVGEAHARTTPERLTLEAVMRAAAAVNVELTLADDAHAVSSGALPNQRHASSSSARDASLPARGAAAGSTRRARRTPGRGGRRSGAATPPQETSSRASSPAGPSEQTAATPGSPAPSSLIGGSPALHGLGPLRPPRLGRYRDAPPTPPRSRPIPPPWAPREHSSAIDGAVAEQLAEFSGGDWRDIYTLAWSMFSGAAALPARMLEMLGRWTADGLAWLRRTRVPSEAPPELEAPPEGWFDEHDLRKLMHHWNAAHEPGYEPRDIIVQRNEHGLLVGHLSLDGDTMAVIQPAPPGRPHSLANLVQLLPDGEHRSWLSKEVPLEIKIGDVRHRLKHVRAGPIFGELDLGDRTLLLTTMSVFFVLVEVRGQGAVVVWVGRGEMLPALTLDAPSSEVAAPTPPGVETPREPSAGSAPSAGQTANTLHVASPEVDGERQRRRAAEEARAEALSKVEAVVREHGEERQRRAAAERAHAHAAQELAARTCELADERQRREVLEREQAAAMLALGLAKQAAVVLPAELAAQAEARERAETEAHLAMRMLKTTIDILMRHVAEDVLADWKRQIVAALVEAGAELGPDVREATQFAAQFISAFRSADAPTPGAGEQEATPLSPEVPQPMPQPGLSDELQTPTTAPLIDPLAEAGTGDAVGGAPTSLATAPWEVTPLPERHAAPDALGPATMAAQVAGDSSDAAPTSPAAPSSDERTTPPSSRRVRQWSKWPPLDPVDVGRKSSPAEARVGRNDPCPCGSGKKYKKCCWR